jgi:preprotein translocase subunit SecG
MQSVIILIHLMIVMAMIGLVLLQRSEGGGLGMGGGGVMSSRGTANMLTRTTAILAGAFFATSLLLSILAGIERKPASILGGSQPGPAAPAAPGAPAPLSQGGRGVLDQLNKPAAPPQGSPAPQSGPQVPQSQ